MKLIASLTSPYARKVRIALAEKKIECDLVEESPWAEETTVPDYNPLGQVPVSCSMTARRCSTRG